jgi:hypothetical protein
VLVAKARDVSSDVRIGRVRLEERAHAGARVGEQDAHDEVDGRRRALDVEQDEGASAAHARGAMCIGPRQTGS